MELSKTELWNRQESKDLLWKAMKEPAEKGCFNCSQRGTSRVCKSGIKYFSQCSMNSEVNSDEYKDDPYKKATGMYWKWNE